MNESARQVINVSMNKFWQYNRKNKDMRKLLLIQSVLDRAREAFYEEEFNVKHKRKK